MFKVKNKKTVAALSKSSFKANMLRNIFAIVAIVLTTLLFTGLFTVVSSLLASMEESTMRQVGGNSHGGFKYLTEEQYDTLKTHKSIKNISYSVVLGTAQNKELAKRPSEIRYASDETNAKGFFAMPTTGRLPKKDTEIATDTLVLESLGIPAKIGEKITLEYSLHEKKYTETFTLVGFWQGDKLMQASQIWLNPSYVKKQLVDYIPTDENDVIGTINADVNFANSINIEKKIIKAITESGYTTNEIKYGVNWAYLGNSNSFDSGTILGGIAVIFMITFCGYLIISNVFYISVAKDIRFYGLLKTIGTTKKQIRFLIRRQALLLCIIGIPLGLIAGYFMGTILTPIILSLLNTNVIKISPHPLLFVASIFFAILTVFISIKKPSKIAASVSPIEALRSTDGHQKSKKAMKKSGGIHLGKMAFANVSRNRKKAALVTISLSLSLIILNSAYSMANSFDMDKYLNNMISSDFAIGDVSYFNVHLDYTNQDTLSSEFRKELVGKNGVEEMSNIYFSEYNAKSDPHLADLSERLKNKLGDEAWLQSVEEELQNTTQIQHIYGIDDPVFQHLEVFEGSIDIEKLKTGNYVIAAPYHNMKKEIIPYYNVGDKVLVANKAGISKEYEVLAIASFPYNISVQHFHPIMPEFILPSNVFLQDIEEKMPMLTTLEVEDSHEAEIDAFLLNYSENIEQYIQYRSKATLAAEYENIQQTYKVIGIILSSLIAFIGIMNFINTIITSIISRKHEFAMLQSIGMTNRQMKTMLVYEGLIYTALTAVFTLTIGSILGYFSIKELAGGGMYFSLQFTVLPSLLCLPVLAVISSSIPLISQSIINKKSIVERLREVE